MSFSMLPQPPIDIGNQTQPTVADWLTMVGTGGFPFSSTDKLSAEAANTKIVNDSNNGIVPYSDAELFRELRHPADVQDDTGIKITIDNYATFGRAESSRLYNLGYTQVHTPAIAIKVFDQFRQFAEPGNSLFTIGRKSGSEKLIEDAVSKTQFSYVIGGVFDDLGSVVSTALKEVKETADVLQNPLALPAIAIIAGAGLFLFLKVK